MFAQCWPAARKNSHNVKMAFIMALRQDPNEAETISRFHRWNRLIVSIANLLYFWIFEKIEILNEQDTYNGGNAVVTQGSGADGAIRLSHEKYH